MYAAANASVNRHQLKKTDKDSFLKLYSISLRVFSQRSQR